MPVSAGAGAPAGRTLGKYTLLGRLAQGGMGEILLARLGGAAGFEKYVVIKRLRRHLDGDERSVQAFLDEARIVARISHPNVCQVHELGVEGGRYYLAMEYLEGLPLSGIIRRANRDRAPLDLRAVSAMIEQASEGLHHVHNLRRMDGAPAAVLHRDVSPQNLFVTVDGVVKVLDFGIAKSGDSSVKTPTGQIMGKSAYMSPEQIRRAPLDQRSDVYSLGVVLYEAVTGQPLFGRGDVASTFRAIREDTLPFLRDVSGELNGVIQRAIARERDERFESARALGRALGAAVTGLGGSMTSPQLAEWLDERFTDDLRERRERAAQAAADGRASTADQPDERIEPGTVIFQSGPIASESSGVAELAASGTMPLEARSDELWSEPARLPATPDQAIITTEPVAGPTPRRPRRSWPWLAGGAAAALLLGATLAVRAAREDADEGRPRGPGGAAETGPQPMRQATPLASEPASPAGDASRAEDDRASRADADRASRADDDRARRAEDDRARRAEDDRASRADDSESGAADDRASRADDDHARRADDSESGAADDSASPAPPSEATAADPARARSPSDSRAVAAAPPGTPIPERAVAAAPPGTPIPERAVAASRPTAPPGEATAPPAATTAENRTDRRAVRKAHVRGYFTIDSMPYAIISIDGVAHGVTPLLRVPLTPGGHTVIAVTADGRRRSFRVKIQPGAEAPRRRLVW